MPVNAPEPKWGTGEFAGSIFFGGGTFCPNFPLGIPQQAEETNHRGSACLSEKPLDSPTPYQRFSRRVVHLAEKLVGTATDNERWRSINEGSKDTSKVVQRLKGETYPNPIYFTGYGEENNALHYKLAPR